MNELAKKLLAEKLVDDFYEEDVRENTGPGEDELSEQLKMLIPADKRELLLLWEAQCAEGCGQELRRFADFVARMILEYRIGCHSNGGE
ncbi:hypothetical protein AYJ22_15710 [Ferroacidibacillus organovorans]|nr:hypothetical protein AYJ22_15710 [Ferroacidibacillus organovorans]